LNAGERLPGSGNNSRAQKRIYRAVAMSFSGPSRGRPALFCGASAWRV
jgi:hypothetical protein